MNRPYLFALIFAAIFTAIIIIFMFGLPVVVYGEVVSSRHVLGLVIFYWLFNTALSCAIVFVMRLCSRKAAS